MKLVSGLVFCLLLASTLFGQSAPAPSAATPLVTVTTIRGSAMRFLIGRPGLGPEGWSAGARPDRRCRA